MIFQRAWNRFIGDWKQFLRIGLWAFGIGLATAAIIALIGWLSIGPAVWNLVQRTLQTGVEPGLADIVGLGIPLLVVTIVSAILVLVVAALVYAGLIGVVSAYRRGEDITFGHFWRSATRYLGRFVALLLLSGLIITAVSLGSMILTLIPVLGWVAFEVVQLALFVYIGIYAGYLIVTEEMGVFAAIAAGFKAIFRNVSEAIFASLVLLAIGTVISLSAVVNVIPLAGQIFFLGIIILYMPFLTYYFIERFETNVRPALQ